MKFHASDLHDVISLQNKYRKLSDFRYSTVRGSNPARSKRFLFFWGGGLQNAHTGSRTTHPPSKRVPRFFPSSKATEAFAVALHLAPRLRISGAIPLLPYMSSLGGQGQFYIFWKSSNICHI